MVDWQPAANVPMTIRVLNADGRFSDISSVAEAERLRAQHPGESLDILALSGGGAYGAFGAGAVAGLTRMGSRPDFTVVTGVSVGALIAPYAFLGPSWDADLLDVFAGAPGKEDLLQSRGLAAIFGSSLYSGKPLQHLVDAHLSDTMIQAIAREAEKGRLLLVATTDVVTGVPVIWDLGAIAQNGGPNARSLLRDVLVASASVPGMFPPVMIRVNKDGVPHDEAHVDGDATMPFFVPPAFMQTPPEARGTNHTAVYVIIDGPLGDAPKTTRLTTRAILTRSINAGLNQMLLTTLELTAATAQLQGATLQYSAVPITHPRGDPYDFRTAMMRPLSRYAYECAQAGRLWTPFVGTDDSSGTSRSIAETQQAQCPADDASIRYFALRGAEPRRTASNRAPINH
jgi:predicted acylesterase/phospholipase RssA